MPDFVFAINEDSCIECGQCRRYCPIAGAIIIDDRYQHWVVADVCTGCGLCEAFCPVPNTLHKVARKTDEKVAASTLSSQQAQAVDYLMVLRRVVWRGRWRYHDHPVMCPITSDARNRLREFHRSHRQGRRLVKVIGVVSDGAS